MSRMWNIAFGSEGLKRRLFNFLSVLSLLLLAATCVLWGRSFYVSDEFRFDWHRMNATEIARGHWNCWYGRGGLTLMRETAHYPLASGWPEVFNRQPLNEFRHVARTSFPPWRCFPSFPPSLSRRIIFSVSAAVTPRTITRYPWKRTFNSSSGFSWRRGWSNRRWGFLSVMGIQVSAISGPESPGDKIDSVRMHQMIQAVESSPQYATFQKRDAELDHLETESLDLERKWVKCERFIRAVEVVALAANLSSVAPPEIQQRYQPLLAAENASIGVPSK